MLRMLHFFEVFERNIFQQLVSLRQYKEGCLVSYTEKSLQLTKCNTNAMMASRWAFQRVLSQFAIPASF